MELLESLLEFNPHFRMPARHCLKHKMFDNIRNPQIEKGAPFKIHLKCDQADSYDYDSQKDNAFPSVEDYYKLVLIEAQKLN